MKKVLVMRSAAAAIILMLATGTVCWGQYSGGRGTEADPCQIATVADWQTLIARPADWDNHFILTADLDFSGAALTPVARDTSTISDFQGTPFTGVFDGNGHIMRNATIDMTDTRGQDYVGLFGYLGSEGRIFNLGVEEVNITGRDCIGGLAGQNCGTITSCYATGTVTGDDLIGGLVGFVEHGKIASCYATGVVTGDRHIGGLVGWSYGTITSCYATGSVTGNDQVGGLIGVYSYYGTIITASFWDIDTSGRLGSSCGKGLTTEQMKAMSIFQNAVWAGQGWVMEDGLDYPRLAWENTGGIPIPEAEPVTLIGSGTQIDPYQVWTEADFALLSWHVSILDKHFLLMADIDLTGVSLYPFGDLGSFTGAFDGAGHILRSATIDQPENCTVGLFGIVGESGQIFNLGVEEVNSTGEDFVGGLAGQNHGTITECYATGVIRGEDWVGVLVASNYGTITSCYATGATTGCIAIGGLAGRNNGTITSCYARGAVTGNKYYIGGLVGWNYMGTITDCYATGEVTGVYHDVGGLIGFNHMGKINSCYATGVVTGGDHNIGGLVGDNLVGTITCCYAMGSVTGDDDVGGLVGRNFSGRIIRSYSTGKPMGDTNVGGLCGGKDTGIGYEDTGNFWDTETSETTTSAMGIGKTTGQMKTKATFTDEGWDFVDEWTICEETNYPRFLWQVPMGDWVCPDGVGLEDLAYFAARWLETGCDEGNNYCGQTDINQDGKVDLIDWSVVAGNWLKGL